MVDKLQNVNSKKEAQTLTPGKRRFIKIFYRTFLILFVSFLLLLAVVFIFIQTDTFNRILLNYTIREINHSWQTKESVFYAESIEGNVLTGLTVSNGNITMRGDTLMKFGSMNVKYNIFRFLQREIMIREAVINEPVINITNVKGVGDTLLWNIDYLFTPKEKKIDTTEFDWDISVRNLKIHNGMVRIIGTKPPNVDFAKFQFPHLEHLDINNLNLFDLEMELEADYHLTSRTLVMKALSFNTNSDFNLQKLTFEVNITDRDTVTQVRNLIFKTNRSELYADNIFLNRLNPLKRSGYENFGDDNVKIVLNTPKFNFKDLKFFFPETGFLDSTVSLDFEAEGKYKSLTINKLILNTPNSYINLKGRVDNLDDPSKLYLDITARDLVIDPRDTRIVLPGLPIPDYSQVGKVYASFNYKGEPQNFKTDFDIKSDAAGNARGTLNLDLNTPGYFYKSQFETSSLNIGRIINNKKLESSLNIKADITGNGFNFNNLSSKVNYEISGSRFSGINVTRSAGSLNIRNKNIEGEVTFVSGSMQSAAKGSINLADFSNPKYTLKGSVRNLNIAEFTKSASDKSDLDFTFDVTGRGLSLNNIDGNYNFVLSESYYSSYHIPSTPVNLKINNSKTNGSIDLVSNLFDFKARGKFNLGEIASVISYNIDVITNEFERNLKYDSFSASSLSYSKKPPERSDFDFEYEFITKDNKALSEMLEQPGYNFNGRVSGRLQNSQSEFLSEADINIKNLSYLDSALQFKNLTGTANLRNDYQKNIPPDRTDFYALSSDIRLNVDSLRISLPDRNLQFDKASVNMNLADGIDNFQISGRKDTSYTVLTNGNVEFQRGLIRLNVDSLYAGYQKYDIRNDSQLVVAYDPNPDRRTFTFEKFNISDSILKVGIEGKLSLKESSDLNIDARSLKVAEIIEYLYPQGPEEPPYVSPVRGNIRRLSVKYTGTLDNPVINLEMNSDLLRYQDLRIGRIDAFLDYKNSILTNDILVSNAESSGKLRITGDIPLANPFSAKDTVSYALANYPVDFKLKANDFQVNFFSKVVPNLTDITGILSGEITAQGTVNQPVLTGYMNVTKGSFYLPITGLRYGFNTNLKTENSNLLVENFRIVNPGDPGRHIDVKGKVNFEGLKINDIDFTAAGDITVIDESADLNELGIYGTVVAGIGNPPLTLKGNLETLTLEGQFLIKSANISSVSFRGSSSYDIYDDNFIYKTVTPDSLEYKGKIVYVSPEKYYEINPFSRARFRIAPQYLTKTTNLDLNLNIKTTRNLILSMTLGNVPKQELVGEVIGDINVNTDNAHRVRVFGRIDIVGDSYYRFYRNFKVMESGIVFNGPPDNPDINFHAVYDFKSNTASNSNVQIVLAVIGTAAKPEVTLKLFENGAEVSGQEAQSDAISYLLFGVPKSQLAESQRSALVKNVGAITGTGYLSSALSGALRSVAPFVLNTELSFTEGNLLQGTDIRITSAFGNATVRVGGRIFSDLSNTEISIQYPMNKLIGSTLGRNLIIEVSRTADFNSTVSADIRTISTGAKLLYIIKY